MQEAIKFLKTGLKTLESTTQMNAGAAFGIHHNPHIITPHVDLHHKDHLAARGNGNGNGNGNGKKKLHEPIVPLGGGGTGQEHNGIVLNMGDSEDSEFERIN